MPPNRIDSHPILPARTEPVTIEFTWQNRPYLAHEGETIAAALIANGIDIFGHHPKDGAPLGLFCANGQCSQCMVLVDGKPVKACMTRIVSGAQIMPADGLPDITGLPADTDILKDTDTQPILDIPVLIIGGGPAGLSAAIELGQLGVKTLLVDDKASLGGKLVLQTHRFFGSTKAVYAGKRGIDIAEKLTEEVTQQPSVKIWLETTAVAVYEDRTVGLWRAQEVFYIRVRPEVLLVATGARERSLPFKGNTLPGIYGAGAFQTLVNRDRVRPAENLLIVGGGNVGLIAGYHALQAGINVVGLVEALPHCGGYKVHEDKLARFDVPIWTAHTILEAKGADHVQSAVIAELDDRFKPVTGTEREIDCDCVLIAVGLNPVDEFISKAQEVGLPVYAAGDAAEVAEASAAMYSGKIAGLNVAHALGIEAPPIPEEWLDFESVLKSRPGEVLTLDEEKPTGKVFPVMHCRQEIPCDPCASVCPNGLIRIDPDDIRHLPEFCELDEKNCIACERCVAICPGLAITLVDFRRDPAQPTVSIPLEFAPDAVTVGEQVLVTDVDGQVLGSYPITKMRTLRQYSRTLIVRVQVPAAIATRIAGIQLAGAWGEAQDQEAHYLETTSQENIVCRCEHVSADEIRDLIRSGVRDINQIKAVTKATMGACGGKTCLSLIENIFREEGIPLEDVTEPTARPLFVETPLSTLAKSEDKS
jgi:NADPH-dependent 2,4-dienoyl-CoA reductase/sulfur reductase-like enzyme/Fe-S-cluster-containing hydrogenase component 2/bacterioferritin-associated ferredoxin